MQIRRGIWAKLGAGMAALAFGCSEPQCPSYLHDEGTDCVVPGEKPAADAGAELGSRISSQSEREVGGSSARGGATAAKSVSATSAGGTGGARDAAAAGTRAEAGGGVGGLPMPSTPNTSAVAGMGGTGMSEAAGAGVAMSTMPGTTLTAPKCGNGVREGTELCDGDCKTECKSDNPCVPVRLEGSAATCDAHCVSASEITACTAGDKCCPQACNHGTDADCSPSCGDGVLTGSETCEPGSKEHPCPTAADCDDGDVCTADTVTGTAAQCSAQCAHALMPRPFLDCADDDPCTDDTIVESASSCRYECPHARSQPAAAPNNCVDDDPCTDDTPVLSKAKCAYECPHALVREGTDCGGGRMCTAGGRCEDPPARCGDGRVSPPEECDPQVPGWAGACGADCRRTLYTQCPCSGGAECISGMCTFSCHSAKDCSRLPDRPVPSCIPIHRNDISKCVLNCTGDADCPSGLVCRTFLDVVKGQAPVSWQYCASADAP